MASVKEVASGSQLLLDIITCLAFLLRYFNERCLKLAGLSYIERLFALKSNPDIFRII